jgi:hypothetical protein
MRILRILFAFATCAALIGPTVYAQPTAPTLLLETDVSVGQVADVRPIKYPDTVTIDSTVHTSATIKEKDAMLWSKQDADANFGAPIKVGDALDNPQYSNTALAVGSDKSLYYAWISRLEGNDGNRERIFLARRAPGAAAFGPTRNGPATNDGLFESDLDMTVLTNNTIILSWRPANRPARYAISTDDGVTWSAPTRLGATDTDSDASLGFSALASGPNNTAVLAYSRGSGDLRQVFGGPWNGSSFPQTPISEPTADFSEASAAIAPNGKIYVAYRLLSENLDQSGVFLAEYVNNSWQRTKVTSNNIVLASYICADPQSNLHLVWIGKANSRANPQVYYSFRPVDGQFVSTPVVVPVSDGTIFNGNVSCNIDETAGKAYAHFMGEYFVNIPNPDNPSRRIDTSTLRYQRFSASITPPLNGPTAKPVIEGDAAYADGEGTVSVAFQEIQGEPAKIRWRWNSAPTDEASDSNGLQTFTNPISIPVPDSIKNDTSCKVSTLFIQLADSADVKGRVNSDQITVDGSVQASVAVTNPYLKRKRSTFDGPTPTDYVDAGGASDGHPDYTRAPIFYLDLGTPGECSGLKEVATGRSATSIRPAQPVNQDRFATIVPFPGAFTAGQNSFTVRVTDKAGNFTDTNRNLVYDNVDPVLNSSSPGTMSISTPLPQATLLATLTFSDVTVTDDSYPGKGFWGIWIANSRSQVSNPTTDTNLVWTPVEVACDTGSFSIARWSLATGIPIANVNAGDYYVYVRFLDGAGNPTDGFLTATINLTQATFPGAYIPMIRR